MELVKLGYMPMFHYLGNKNVYEETNNIAIPFFHYFVMMSTIFPSWAYIYYRHHIITKKGFIYILIVATFILINTLSRIDILLFSVSTFLTFNYYFRFSLKKKLAFGFIIITIFLVVGAVRISQISQLSQAEYFRGYGNVSYKTNLIEGTLVSYSSLSFSRFNKIVEHNDLTNISLGKYMLRPFFSVLFLEKLGVIKYEPDTQKLVLTYVIDPFLDFSFFGVILFNLFFGFYSMHSFRRYINYNEDSIVTWSLIVFCLIMTPFVNFVYTFFIVFFWFINQLLMSSNSSDRSKLLLDKII